MNGRSMLLTTKDKLWRIAPILTLVIGVALSGYGGGHAAAQSGDSAAGEQAQAELKQGKGFYVGLADGHTLEITWYGQGVAFQFGDAVREQVEALNEGDKVHFTYITKVYTFEREEGAETFYQHVLQDVEVLNDAQAQ
ncbi:hypothetical protein IDH44_17390 [Paenibacillus sp. IB182496]|uniref:DUF3221 domain-containing protein n=1 Tax=Paenibacillus sabuli TaxID=2772509 RepID=A0A927GSP5_9BACL|nr:hypothetical protein [Paenibacillus sabuli]MBD2846974.1 hypothetical protein [Paenibacillus sabuli]